MARIVDEWIGKTDDTPIPLRVKLRVFERFGGRCYLSKRKITPADQWDCDHVLALINGGENRESNLAPAIKDKHREKTAEDVRIKSEIARRKAKHLGLAKPKGRGFDKRFTKKMDGTVVLRRGHS